MSAGPLGDVLVVVDGHPIDAVASALDGGATGVWLRDRSVTDAGEQRVRAGAVARLAGTALVASSATTSARLGCGLHVSFREPIPAALPPGSGASCHDTSEVDRAVDVGASYVTVSPVLHPRSKPTDLAPLGWAGLRGLSDATALPVYALGGIDSTTAATAMLCGAAGVASMSCLADADPAAAAADLAQSARAGRAVRMALLDVGRTVAAHTGAEPIAVLLHGSWATSTPRPGSDVDVIVVVTDAAAPTTADEQHRLGSTLADAWPGGLGPLELSVCTDGQAGRPTEGGFVVHVATGDERVVAGTGGRDPDLTLHALSLRSSGLAVTGPWPTDVIGPVDRLDVLAAMDDEIAWALAHDRAPDAVLTACRAWHYCEHDQALSKGEAATWGHARVFQRDRVAADAVVRAWHETDRRRPPDAADLAVCEMARSRIATQRRTVS